MGQPWTDPEPTLPLDLMSGRSLENVAVFVYTEKPKRPLSQLLTVPLEPVSQRYTPPPLGP